jgi:hypothetical protein
MIYNYSNNKFTAVCEASYLFLKILQEAKLSLY